MQYPIIDLITDAYINNGWTGLDITKSVNIFNENPLLQGGLSSTTGEAIEQPFTLYADTYIKVTPLTMYRVIIPNSSIYICAYTNDKTYIGPHGYVSNNTIFTTFSNEYYIRFQTNANYGMIYKRDISINYPPSDTEYHPYFKPYSDFSHRLKLPLPHYFPHPVIDALQRAASGTQTADDTEILRHYLTPLGIGGI